MEVSKKPKENDILYYFSIALIVIGTIIAIVAIFVSLLTPGRKGPSGEQGATGPEGNSGEAIDSPYTLLPLNDTSTPVVIDRITGGPFFLVTKETNTTTSTVQITQDNNFDQGMSFKFGGVENDPNTAFSYSLTSTYYHVLTIPNYTQDPPLLNLTLQNNKSYIFYNIGTWANTNTGNSFPDTLYYYYTTNLN